MKPIFICRVCQSNSDGQTTLEIDSGSQKSLNEYCKKFKEGQKVKFTLSRLTKKTIRSVEQNAYYWGVVIKILAEELGYIGTGEKEDLHEELKAMFLVKKGKIGTYVEQTSKLDTETYERYLKAIRGWALQFQNIYIPKPNEVEISSDTYTRI